MGAEIKYHADPRKVCLCCLLMVQRKRLLHLVAQNYCSCIITAAKPIFDADEDSPHFGRQLTCLTRRGF